MSASYEIFPVGVVRKRGEETFIEIYHQYLDALLGLEGFSHILVLSWLDKNDTPEKRRTLRVHPRADPSNPLTGVFATRSPVRPNLIGLSTCRLLSVEGNMIRVEKIDAFDGTPVIDIKPCISDSDLAMDLRVPEWVDKNR